MLIKLKIFVQNLLFWKPTNGWCHRLTSSNVFTVKKMCSRWYCFQFNKIGKAWFRVGILWLDFPKTRSNHYIKSRKAATLENCEIFSNLYFSYVPDYKAILSGGNKKIISYFFRNSTQKCERWTFPLIRITFLFLSLGKVLAGKGFTKELSHNQEEKMEYLQKKGKKKECTEISLEFN